MIFKIKSIGQALFYQIAVHCCRFELTVSGHVDCPRRDVNVHEIVDDPVINVIKLFLEEISNSKTMKTSKICHSSCEKLSSPFKFRQIR